MSRSDPSETGATRRLRVDLDVEPEAGFACPITDADADVEDVRINAVGNECNVDIQPSEAEAPMIRAEGEVSEDCLCYVFKQFDCVPHVRGVEDGTMAVSTYVDDRTAVRGLVERLRDVVADVTLARLTIVDGPNATEQATFDLSALTPKQREALELAVVRGYFDDDVDTSLGDLADELSISKSALSQRLRTAQSKIVTELFDARDA